MSATPQTDAALLALNERRASIPSVENPGPRGGTTPAGNDYRSSALCGSTIEQDAAEALYGYNPPNFAIAEEKPEHRMVCILKLQGRSLKDIASITKLGYQWVCQIVRQPWAVKYMAEEMQRQGRDSLHELLASSAEDSVHTLIEMRDNPKAKAAERITAANSLLNRFLGNPTQPIAHSGKVDMSTMNDEDLAKIAFAGGVGSGAI